MSNQEILEVKNLKVNFDVRSEGDMPWTKAKKLKAVNDVSFSLKGWRNAWSGWRVWVWKVDSCKSYCQNGARRIWRGCLAWQ
jgi:hypothetical protein